MATLQDVSDKLSRIMPQADVKEIASGVYSLTISLKSGIFFDDIMKQKTSIENFIYLHFGDMGFFDVQLYHFSIEKWYSEAALNFTFSSSIIKEG